MGLGNVNEVRRKVGGMEIIMNKKKYSYLAFILFLIGMLSGCNQSVSEMDTNAITTADVVYGASGNSDYSYTDTGFFSLSGNMMQYYDLETEQRYVLCSNPGCFHSGDKCSAYYGRVNGVIGLAGYNGSVYAFIFNEENNSYEFTKMNMLGEDRKVLASFEIGRYEMGTWVTKSISLTDYIYAGDMVWTSLQKEWLPETEGEPAPYITQLIGIHLETGEVLYLNTEEELAYGGRYEYEQVTKDFVFLQRYQSKEELLSKEAFYEAYENGLIDRENPVFEGMEYESLYKKYCTSYYRFSTSTKVSYLVYDINKKEIRELETEENPYVEYNENGFEEKVLGSYIAMGTYDGKVLCQKEDWSTRICDIVLWNMETNEKEVLLEKIPQSGANVSWDGSTFSENELLLSEQKEFENGENGRILYSYHLDTGEWEELYEGCESEDFFPRGVCGDYLVGMIEDTWTYISIDDFKAGNIEKAVKL